MAADPTSPITRLTDEQRLIAFENKASEIYTRFSPYSDSGQGISVGSQQPYVWTTPNDSQSSRDLTKYDTQAIPIGSTIRDVERLGKFLTSGTGLLYIGKQYLLQRQTAFNEVRVYNPLSVIAAASAQGSTGLIDLPVRYVDGGFGGGLLNFARSSLSSFIDFNSPPASVEGVASGNVSNYAGAGLTKGKGLVHLEAAKSAQDRFNSLWIGNNSNPSNFSIGNFLQKLGTSLLSRFVPSTQPLGFGNSETSNWIYRVEYPNDKPGAYHAFRDDSSGFLKYEFNGAEYETLDVNPYSAGVVQGGAGTAPKDGWYYPPGFTDDQFISRVDKQSVPFNGIETRFSDLESAVFQFNEDFNQNPMGNKRNLKDQSFETRNDGQNYVDALGEKGDPPDIFTDNITDILTLDSRGFSKAPKRSTTSDDWGNSVTSGTEDTYNILNEFFGDRRSDGSAPDSLMLDADNSKDIIFFYFYDLVNGVYLPFRATVSGLNDLHSPDWEEISYLGRADKLYIYKGFTREVNFSFTVYANSLKEMLPMWRRINYLVGLSRPSKYTSGADTTNQFMYPPMTTLRLGDMYVDQPCVLKSIGVNVPEDAVWETQRGTSYTYLQGTGIDLSPKNVNGDYIYQLPTKVEITINMSIMEKARSIVDGDHFFISR